MGVSTLPQPLHFTYSLGMFPEEASVTCGYNDVPPAFWEVQAEPLTGVWGFTW